MGTGWQQIEGDNSQAFGSSTHSHLLVTKRSGSPQITKSRPEGLVSVSTWRTAAAVTAVLGARWTETSPRVKEDHVLSFWRVQSSSPSNIQVRMLGSYSTETPNFCSTAKFYNFFFQNGNQNRRIFAVFRILFFFFLEEWFEPLW